MATDIATALAAAGVPSPSHDARALVRHAAETGSDLDTLVTARAARVPLQHLLGSAGFRYLDVPVGPGVFIPRPETELLVDAVLAAITGIDAPIVVDLCAGTGCIGLSVRHEHPTAQVDLVENSAEAFDWLRRNAAGLDRVTPHLADLADAPSGVDGRVDVVVANPPYLPLGERVDPEVRDHDPAVALWGGTDGLDVIRRVVARARQLLRPAGTAVIEHAEGHQPEVLGLLSAAGFVDATRQADLTGRPRFVTARMPSC